MSTHRPVVPRWLRLVLMPPTLALVILALTLATTIKLLEMAVNGVADALKTARKDGHVE